MTDRQSHFVHVHGEHPGEMCRDADGKTIERRGVLACSMHSLVVCKYCVFAYEKSIERNERTGERRSESKERRAKDRREGNEILVGARMDGVEGGRACYRLPDEELASDRDEWGSNRRQGQRRGASQESRVRCVRCNSEFTEGEAVMLQGKYLAHLNPCPAPPSSVENAAKQQPDEYWTKRMAIVLPKIVEPMKAAARAKGYALAFHGSLSRDIDCIAVPWTDDASSAADVAEAIRQAAADANGGIAFSTPEDDAILPIAKPHGRLAWRWHLGGGPYIDLSVTASSSVPKLVEALRELIDVLGDNDYDRIGIAVAKADKALSDYDSHSLARNEKGESDV